MSEFTVAASGVRALLELAVSRGANRSALTERSGIDPAELEDGDNRIPFDKYVALMKAGQCLCNDPALALHFGESVDASEFSPIHQIGASSMAEAIAVGNRYARLTVEVDEGSSDRYVISRSGGRLWLTDTRKNPNDFPELTESSFARMVCTMRRAVGEKSLVKEVHVTHAEPKYRAEYDRIFRVPVVFDSDKNALLVDESVLSFKPPMPPAYASQVLTAHADELLEKLESSKSTRGRVERLLMPSLANGDVSMKAIAGKLGVSRQTLFRKLKSEGVTFENVLDDLRHKLALHYLSANKKSVNQTAYLVGFSDPAAFSRAFKRWTGSSPRTHIAATREA
jgi:AraC-like DNA-binding protein